MTFHHSLTDLRNNSMKMLSLFLQYNCNISQHSMIYLTNILENLFLIIYVATKYPRANSKGTKGNPNNSEPLTISNMNSKVNGIDSKQECLEKHLLEHVCGINIVEF